MRTLSAIIAVVIAYCVQLSQHACADTVFLKNGERRFGLVVEQNAETITFSNNFETENQAAVSIPLADVDLVVRSIDIKKLEQLNPQFPNGYCELAEDLLRHRDDRIAMELGFRLLTIAIAHGDETVRESSVKSLDEFLNESQKERLKQYLDSFKRNLSADAQQPFVVTRKHVDRLLELSRSLRREKWSETEELLGDGDLKQAYEHWSHLVTWRELNEAFESRRISRVMLLKILRLETDLAPASVPLEVAPREAGWLTSGSKNFSAATKLPTLEVFQEIDAEKAIFRGGKWIKTE